MQVVLWATTICSWHFRKAIVSKSSYFPHSMIVSAVPSSLTPICLHLVRISLKTWMTSLCMPHSYSNRESGSCWQ